jgi:hypothetical protein
VNQLIVTVESGHGNNTTPLILLESKVKGEVRHKSIVFGLGTGSGMTIDGLSETNLRMGGAPG